MENDDLLQDFVVESNEHLEDIEAELLTIEDQGDDFEEDLVNKVFRALHSIKGASGFLGLERICELSHSMESVLNAIRSHDLSVSSEIIDTLLKSSDVLKAMLEDIAGSNEFDIVTFVQALESVNTESKPKVEAVTPAPTQATPEPEPEPEPSANAEAEEPKPESPPAPSVSAPSATPAKPAAKSKPTPATSGEAKKTERASTASTSTATVRVPVSVLDHLMNLAGELVLGRNQLIQTLSAEDPVGLDLVGSRIDQITSELQEAIMETRMQPVGNVFSKFPRVVRDLSGLIGKQVNLVTEGDDVELDKTIIEAISDPLTHLVRNAVDHGVETPEGRQANGKPACGQVVLRAFHDGGTVNLTISDDGAGIDVEVLKAKAVEKGILTPDRSREMSDRDARRLIFHPGFSTKEQVTDISGRGVGMDVVSTNLEKLGGTIEIESELGVGTTLAVKLPLTLAIIPALIVRSSSDSFALPQLNILELVRVKDGDEGTRIERLKGAEVLRLRGRLLPLIRLDETIGCTAAGPLEHRDVEARESAALSDEASEESEARSDSRRDSLNIIVVAAGQLQYGLVVDDLRDSEEIVVKPLGRHIKDAPCFSGATILGDGHIALILDIAGIANFHKLDVRGLADEKAEDGRSESSSEQSEDKQSVILFHNHPGEHFAIPAGAVARIDRIDTNTLVNIGGVEAVQGRDKILPILRLESQVSAKPMDDNDTAYVIVVEAEDREIGLLVSTLVDVQDITTKVDTMTIREPGISGSVTLDGAETRLIDIFELADHAHPEWFSGSGHSSKISAPGMPTHEHSGEFGVGYAPSIPRGDHESGLVMVVDDSGFFRRKVCALLRESGYAVIDVADGQAAWTLLQSSEHDIRLVVTDVEMPHMDGLELAAAIRSHAELKDMPVIALTSLATDEDIQRGRDVGITDYQVKLDRDRLLAKIEEHYTREAIAGAQR